MLKKICLTLAAIVVLVVVVFLGAVVMQPSEFRISRTATIPAPVSEVFDHVNDFHKWETWSPWSKLDPASKTTFEGASAGTGAVFKWSGNDDVGEGSMTLTESRPNDLIRIKLEFVKPFAGTCQTEFSFRPEGEQTVVTWTMTGKNDFVGKAFCLFSNMDETIGGQFEQGLASMKAVVTSPRY